MRSHTSMSWRLIAGSAFAGVDVSSMAFCSRSRLARSMSSMLPSIILSKLRWSRSLSGFCFVSTALTGRLTVPVLCGPVLFSDDNRLSGGRTWNSTSEAARGRKAGIPCRRVRTSSA